MKAALVTGVVLVLVLFLLMAALVWAFQERLAYVPPGPPYPDGGTRRVDFNAADGQPLFAFVLAPDEPSGRVVLAFHGNADQAGWQVPWARQLVARTRATVVLAEYRGYAGTGGRPTYEGIQLDARAAWTMIRDTLGTHDADVVLYGHSLGSAVAAELALEHAPRAVVLVAPFTSAREMSRRIVSPVFTPLWGMISRVRYDTESAVRRLEAPVWVAHGEDDALIPAAMGRRVFAAARRPGELLLIPRAGHNDVVDAGGDRYWDWLERAVGVAGR